MNICLSGGTGTGKTTLLNTLPNSINKVIDTKLKVVEDLPTNFTNTELYLGTVKLLESSKNTVFDRSPIDWLVGCILRRELNLVEALNYLSKVNLTHPVKFIIVPVPPIEIFTECLNKKQSRLDHWKIIFPEASTYDQYYQGAIISHELGMMLSKHLERLSPFAKVLYAKQSSDEFFSWTPAVKFYINEQLGN